MINLLKFNNKIISKILMIQNFIWESYNIMMQFQEQLNKKLHGITAIYYKLPMNQHFKTYLKLLKDLIANIELNLKIIKYAVGI